MEQAVVATRPGWPAVSSANGENWEDIHTYGPAAFCKAQGQEGALDSWGRQGPAELKG